MLFTTTVSPGERAASIRRYSGRSKSLPLALSAKTSEVLTPKRASASVCRSRFWSRELTLAYPYVLDAIFHLRFPDWSRYQKSLDGSRMHSGELIWQDAPVAV